MRLKSLAKSVARKLGGKDKVVLFAVELIKLVDISLAMRLINLAGQTVATEKDIPMDNKKIASELVALAKDIVAADTFKCPDCDSKVLEQTSYCVKCKKKVKKAGAREARGNLRDVESDMGIRFKEAAEELAGAYFEDDFDRINSRLPNSVATKCEAVGEDVADVLYTEMMAIRNR